MVQYESSWGADRRSAMWRAGVLMVGASYWCVTALLVGACETDTCAADVAFPGCVFQPPEEQAEGGRCCGGQGLCLQAGVLPASQARQLASDSCQGEREVCVPLDLATPGTVPASCRSIGETEGRCLPECLPRIAAVAALLPQSTCAAGARCAPCFDPLSGQDTGSCSLALHDFPREAPAQPSAAGESSP